MKTSLDKIKWNYYKQTEGPMYIGALPYELPENPSLNDKWIAVITTAEGGHFDAINMYDRMIVSVGLIQFGEAALFNVSNMLGTVCEKVSPRVVLDALAPALKLSNAEFKKNSSNLWRFFHNGQEVKTYAQQQKLFLSGSGARNSWSDEQKTYAKTWAACLADVWYDENARKVQVDFTAQRLVSFVLNDAKKVLFDDATGPWVEATRAIAVSYAVNLPAVLAKMVVEYQTHHEKWSENWCMGLIQRMTLTPNISLYPHRYNAFRSVVEKLWGISMPKTARDLASWRPSSTGNVVTVVEEEQKPIVLPEVVIEAEPEEVKQDPVVPTPIVVDKPTFWDVLFSIIKMIIDAILRRKQQ